MNILVLNCGSSSLKFQVIDTGPATALPEPGRRLARGVVERIGGKARLDFRAGDGAPQRAEAEVPDHAAAVRRVVDWIAARSGANGIAAVGHRVVHGGARFTAPVLLDSAVMAALEELETLAPLHNAPSVAGIRACRDVFGARVPMVAVFDTAFHATLPEHAARYAIPHEPAARHGIRRYGFHGTAFRSVLARYSALTGTAAAETRVVALHLGNGCSAAAVDAGRSVDTSMGLTPLEGLVMGTRSGDLDPAVVGHLARAEGLSLEEAERWLNERSGLLGLSGRSRDMRDLLAHEASDPRARLAVDVFCHRARKYVGAYLAVLGGADAILFSGGIGENAPAVRARICAGMAWCGLALDPARNAAAVGTEARISDDAARIGAFVIPADEEAIIARDTAACLGRGSLPPLLGHRYPT